MKLTKDQKVCLLILFVLFMLFCKDTVEGIQQDKWKGPKKDKK